MVHPIEWLYPNVPVWAQNLGISLYGITWRRERLGGNFEAHVEGFRDRDRWSPEQMRAYVEQELRRVLVHCVHQVPYYQRVWSKRGLPLETLMRMTLADLFEVPITPKQDLRAAPEEFVAQDVARRSKLRRYYSSGTTGTPITSICNSDGHRRFFACREVRSFGWAGTSLRRPRSMIGGRLVVPKGIARPPFHRYNLVEKQVYFSAYHIAPAHVADYVRALNQYQPCVLTGYAYSHYLLARMMCAQRLSLDYEPEALVLSSEKLTAEMKRVIQKAFRARAFEEYGAVEQCMLATECEHGRLHVNSDFGILEIVDADGYPVPPGVEGRILCTSLLNEAQPLVRYDIGDVGIWSAVACPCGRNHLPVLQEVVGRLEDVVIGPDGREMVRFHGIFVDLPHVVEGQVIQETLDKFTLKVVAREGFGAEQEQLIRRRFAERLGPVDVRIERVAEIARTERGKFRAVICRLSEPGRRNAAQGAAGVT
jgi:phenylacetate-CoA ligase